MIRNLTRFTRAAAVALALAAGLASQAYAITTWRLSTKVPLESPDGKVLQKFAELVAAQTKGELVIRIFGSEQLGSSDSVLEQLNAGTIHVFAESADYFSKWVPEFSYTSSPFVFGSREHWQRFMNTPLVKGWQEKARAASGITVIGNVAGIVRGPYRVLVTSRPITKIDNLKGLKLRMFNDELAVEAWTYLGADVRVMGFGDVYPSIQSGLLEAVTTPAALVQSMKFYEVAPYIVRTNEFFQGTAFMANEKAYNALSPEVRAGLLRAYEEVAVFNQQLLGEAVDKSMKFMAEKKAVYSEVDAGPFVEKMRVFYQARGKAGKLPAGFLEAVEASR